MLSMSLSPHGIVNNRSRSERIQRPGKQEVFIGDRVDSNTSFMRIIKTAETGAQLPGCALELQVEPAIAYPLNSPKSGIVTR